MACITCQTQQSCMKVQSQRLGWRSKFQECQLAELAFCQSCQLACPIRWHCKLQLGSSWHLWRILQDCSLRYVLCNSLRNQAGLVLPKIPTYKPTVSSVATPNASTMNGRNGHMTFMVNPSTMFIMPSTVSTCREMPPSVVHTGAAADMLSDCE